jgi:hypothetical protein
MDRALHIATKEAKVSDYPMAVVLIAKTLAEGNKVHIAIRAAKTLEAIDSKTRPNGGLIKQTYYPALAFEQIAEARAKENDILGAKSVLNTMPGLEYWSVLAAIAEAYCRRGNNTDAAGRTADHIVVPDQRHRALLAVAAAYMRKNQPGDARAVFLQAGELRKELSAGFEGLVEDANLVGTLADCGDFDNAGKILETIPPHQFRQLALGRIALAHARRGEFEKTTTTLGLITNAQPAIASLQEIAVLQARAGQLEAALETAALLPEVEGNTQDVLAYPITHPRFDTLIALFKNAAPKHGPATLNELISSLPTPQDRAAAYIGLAQGRSEIAAPAVASPN